MCSFLCARIIMDSQRLFLVTRDDIGEDSVLFDHSEIFFVLSMPTEVNVEVIMESSSAGTKTSKTAKVLSTADLLKN